MKNIRFLSSRSVHTFISLSIITSLISLYISFLWLFNDNYIVLLRVLIEKRKNTNVCGYCKNALNHHSLTLKVLRGSVRYKPALPYKEKTMYNNAFYTSADPCSKSVFPIKQMIS